MPPAGDLALEVKQRLFEGRDSFFWGGDLEGGGLQSRVCGTVEKRKVGWVGLESCQFV